MIPTAYFVKFSRTCYRDYEWLCKLSNMEKEDYGILERAFNDYRPVKMFEDTKRNCGLLQLSGFYCYFFCYRTSRKDDCGRQIYALDGICIGKEHIGTVGALYFLMLSNPCQYIQNEELFLDEDNVIDFEVDLKPIFDDFIANCNRSIHKDNINRMCVSLPPQKVEVSAENCLHDLELNRSPLASGKPLKEIFHQEDDIHKESENVGNVICNQNNSSRETKDNRPLDKSKGTCTLLISLEGEKKFLISKIGKLTAEAFSNEGELILYVERYYIGRVALEKYIDDIKHVLADYGFNVTVDTKWFPEDWGDGPFARKKGRI